MQLLRWEHQLLESMADIWTLNQVIQIGAPQWQRIKMLRMRPRFLGALEPMSPKLAVRPCSKVCWHGGVQARIDSG